MCDIYSKGFAVEGRVQQCTLIHTGLNHFHFLFVGKYAVTGIIKRDMKCNTNICFHHLLWASSVQVTFYPNYWEYEL